MMQNVLSKGKRLAEFHMIIQQFRQKVQDQNIVLPKFAKIVEVGPRDGLQNEKMIVPAKDKIKLINMLSESGLKSVEVTSFVSPKWVPQMGDNAEVFMGINKKEGVSYPVLVPNVKGLEQALKANVKEIAIFGAASEGFTKKNINCTIEESYKKFEEVILEAKKHNLKIRGYVSTVLGCPYEGDVNPKKVAEVAQKLYDLGCYEISLGDTIGIGTPEKTEAMLDAITGIPKDKLAVHFHDTFDKAISNIFVALEKGISVFDCSVAGLGGCPYAKKPVGNVCTENVVFALSQLRVETGVNLMNLCDAGQFITQILGKENQSMLI